MLAVAAAAAPPRWEAGVGVAALHLPDYPGAARSRTYVLPFPYLVYRGERLRVDGASARGRLLAGRRMRLDLSVFGTVPVRGDDGARQGMPDLDPLVEAGPALEIDLDGAGRWRLELPLRLAWAAGPGRLRPAGLTFTPALRRRAEALDGRLTLSVGLAWSDRRRHGYVYDVDAAFATPWRPSYRADGGYGGAHLQATWSRRRGPWLVGAYLRYDLLDDAVFLESPLVARRRHLQGGLALTRILLHARSAGEGP